MITVSYYSGELSRIATSSTNTKILNLIIHVLVTLDTIRGMTTCDVACTCNHFALAGLSIDEGRSDRRRGC